MRGFGKPQKNYLMINICSSLKFINLSILAIGDFKMNEDYDKKVKNLLNKFKASQDVGRLGDKIQKQDFTNRMIKVNQLYNKVMNNIEYLKCLLVLFIKQITWKRELKEKFNCSGSIIEYFDNYMKDCGLIINKQLVDLDNCMYEAILKTNTSEFYYQSTKVNLIALTPDGLDFCNRVLNDFKSDRQDIYNIINNIEKKSLAFRSAYEKLKQKENELSDRLIKYPDGTLIERESEARKKLNKDVNEALLEIKREKLLEKKEQKLLTSKESKELSLIEKKGDLALLDDNNKSLTEYVDPIVAQYKKTGRPSITYNGMYKHLTNNELEKMVDGESKQEIKEIEKEYAIEPKKKIDKINKLHEIEEKNNLRDCDDFIERLGGYK